jgi:hypothetical protein
VPRRARGATASRRSRAGQDQDDRHERCDEPASVVLAHSCPHRYAAPGRSPRPIISKPPGAHPRGRTSGSDIAHTRPATHHWAASPTIRVRGTPLRVCCRSFSFATQAYREARAITGDARKGCPAPTYPGLGLGTRDERRAYDEARHLTAPGPEPLRDGFMSGCPPRWSACGRTACTLGRRCRCRR